MENKYIKEALHSLCEGNQMKDETNKQPTKSIAKTYEKKIFISHKSENEKLL